MKINFSKIKKPITRIIIFTLISFVVTYFLTWLWVASRVNIDTKVKSDVIVVLGARIYLKPDVLNPCMVSRVDHAVNLYKDKYAKKIIFSGGVDKEDGVIEAEKMKLLAMKQGVSESDILTESQSKSTFENIKNTRELMDKSNLKTAIIVTEPFHTPRAALVAKKQKMGYTISPAYSSCWSDWRYLSRFLVREPAAIINYLWQDKI